jgi:hypothetical protein
MQLGSFSILCAWILLASPCLADQVTPDCVKLAAAELEKLTSKELGKGNKKLFYHRGHREHRGYQANDSISVP